MSAAVPITTTPAVAPAPTISRPRDGRLRDAGSVRRDAVRATAWTTSGTVKVQGDVDVVHGTIVGLASVGGKLTAGSFRASGTLEVVGTTDVREQLTLAGSVHLEGKVHAGMLDVRGSLRSGSEVRVDRVLRVSGSFEAPSASIGLLDLTGTTILPGELTALAAVRARFRGDSEIGSIRAKSVVLDGPAPALIPTLLRIVFGGSGTVHVGRIEAESVELSAVTVEFVRSPSISLGPGCHVREVEGTVVRRHPSSRVGPESRSAPPHGLRR